VYLNYVITFGRTFQDHLLNRKITTHRFHEDYLNLNPKRDQLSEKEVRYFEHTVTSEEITTNTITNIKTLIAVWNS
jgi:hypothetical protein